MRRSPRAVIAWIAVVVVAITTARVVQSDLGALHRRARTLGPDVRVVVARRDLPIGTTIAASDITTVTRPSSTVVADALRAADAAVGRVVAVTVLRDDVVRRRQLTRADRDGITGLLAPGRRAVHVVAADGYQPPAGATVDVLATFDADAFADAPQARARGGSASAHVVAAGAQVVGVDTGDVTITESGSGASGSGDTTTAGVTLLVTDADAAAIAYAAALGQITFALAPPETACCTSPTS